MFAEVWLGFSGSLSTSLLRSPLNSMIVSSSTSPSTSIQWTQAWNHKDNTFYNRSLGETMFLGVIPFYTSCRMYHSCKALLFHLPCHLSCHLPRYLSCLRNWYSWQISQSLSSFLHLLSHPQQRPGLLTACYNSSDTLSAELNCDADTQYAQPPSGPYQVTTVGL